MKIYEDNPFRKVDYEEHMLKSIEITTIQELSRINA